MINMKKVETHYLTQYCNMVFEWRSKGLDIDSASEAQVNEMQELRAKAIEQSGLSDNELTLISLCRNKNILNKVYMYARHLTPK